MLQPPDHTLHGAISQATTLLSSHQSRGSLPVSLRQHRRPQGGCLEAQPARAGAAAGRTAVVSGRQAVVGFARLSKQELLCDSRAVGPEQPQRKAPQPAGQAGPGACASPLPTRWRVCLSVCPLCPDLVLTLWYIEPLGKRLGSSAKGTASKTWA